MPSKDFTKTISIIGAGRLGTALAIALDSRGYDIQAVVARRLNHAQKAARTLSSNSRALREGQLGDLPDSNLFLISTPDDAISAVVAQLKVAKENSGRKGTVLHTSGALSSAVLDPLAEPGFHTGSLHPLVSISNPEVGASAFGGAFFCLEGDKTAMRVGKGLVKDLGGRSFSIESSHKALYHAAAVMSSGHVTALFDVAVEMLTKCGLTPDAARRILLPLLESTWKNLTTSDSAGALTGTFARGDEATVEKHLAAMKSANIPDALAAYRLLGERSLKLLAQKGGEPEVIKRISSMLTKLPRKIG
jgi:predicted short-subunit dehydrogenase-like oxidoreductase (DUF2520 family)